MWEICKRLEREVQREEVNCEPLSEVRVCGTPKREIQEERKTSAQEEEEMEDRGVASTQRVVLSIMVMMWEFPWEMGRGPTMSTWTWEKRLSGMGMESGEGETWR